MGRGSVKRERSSGNYCSFSLCTATCISDQRSLPNKGMQALIPPFERSFFGAIRRTLSTPWPAHHLNYGFRYCAEAPSVPFPESSQTSEEGEEKEEPNNLCGRIESLPRTELVGSAFRSWMGDGFPIHRGDIFHTINRLRRRQLNKRALEVCFSFSCLNI